MLSSLLRSFGGAGVLVLAVVGGSLEAQPANVVVPIRQCGNLLSDRIHNECAGKNQVVLNASGVQRGTPTLPSTEDDRLDSRQTELGDLNQRNKLERRRRDNLLTLFPDETHHEAARVRDLAVADVSIKAAMTRAENLRVENRRLMADVSNKSRGALSQQLRLLIDRNESAMRDVAGALSNSREERASVSMIYDEERMMLRKLWAGGRQ